MNDQTETAKYSQLQGSLNEFSRMGNGEGRDLAKAQQSTNEGPAGLIAKARRERSIIHEKFHGKRRKEEEIIRTVKKSESFTENCFHLEAIMNISTL
jgi:hypothetical protein